MAGISWKEAGVITVPHAAPVAYTAGGRIFSHGRKLLRNRRICLPGIRYRAAGHVHLRRLLQRPHLGAAPQWLCLYESLLADTTLSISTFGEDEAAELYVADYATGNIYRIGEP